MPCTVQQGAHICLVSPSNIDHQHSCKARKKIIDVLSISCDNKANYTKTAVMFTQMRDNYTEAQSRGNDHLS